MALYNAMRYIDLSTTWGMGEGIFESRSVGAQIGRVVDYQGFGTVAATRSC